MLTYFQDWRERRRAFVAMQEDLAYLRRRLDHVAGRVEDISMDLTKLQAAVAQETAVDQSAVVLIQSIADALKQTGGNQAAVDALADQLSASATALAASVTANTQTPPPPTV